MKKSKGYDAPCFKPESTGKAKSRIKRFEQNLECNHRLANTYANNQPGEVPTIPGVEAGIAEGLTKHAAMGSPRRKKKHSYGPVVSRSTK